MICASQALRKYAENGQHGFIYYPMNMGWILRRFFLKHSEHTWAHRLLCLFPESTYAILDSIHSFPTHTLHRWVVEGLLQGQLIQYKENIMT